MKNRVKSITLSRPASKVVKPGTGAEPSDEGLLTPQQRNSGRSANGLTAGERSVLKVFRWYRMTPGHMLCFSGPKHDTHRNSLSQLITKGALTGERFRGGYSLTKHGYGLMLEDKSAD